jgi:hypothetical protein
VTHGYHYVRLSKDGANRNWRLHRLVWESIIGPTGIHHVDHIDGDKSNNAFSNLRVLTAKANIQAAMALGLRPRGTKHHSAKLTDDDVRAIRLAAFAGEYQRDISKRFGVTQRAVTQIIHRKTWSHVQ